MAFNVARYHGHGTYFARKIVKWELQFLKGEEVAHGKKGCHAKTRSWFNDEGVLLAAREYIAGAGEKVTAYALAKAIGNYLDSERATEAVNHCLNPESTSIRAHTARGSLHKLGLHYTAAKKGVYVDGHERQDVKDY
jgi:hypothetical protein